MTESQALCWCGEVFSAQTDEAALGLFRLHSSTVDTETGERPHTLRTWTPAKTTTREAIQIAKLREALRLVTTRLHGLEHKDVPYLMCAETICMTASDAMRG